MANRVGQQFGHYRLLNMIGRGGFADVYLGEHLHLQTQAAVKVLSMPLAGEHLEQFRSEARIVAHLVHPHIVRVLDFGVEDAIPYLVMDYAPHGSLRTLHQRGTRLPLNTIVSYVKQVTNALHYTHEKKLIHRDVKPENMLLGENRQVLLSDFGIALITQSTRYHNTQDIIGTVAYMAPEQLQGKPRRASDQYALGIVVYEWICGDRPFHGSFTEIYSQHLFVPPPSLREKVPELPASVEKVILTALNKEPDQRFSSVQAFADALEHAYRTDQPIPAVSSSYRPLSHPKQITPVASRPSAPQVASLSRIGTTLLYYRGHGNKVYAVAWSPDGSRVVSGGEDNTVQIWDAATGKHLLSFEKHPTSVHSVAWSPDSSRIASGSYARMFLWDAKTGIQLFPYRGHGNGVDSLAWSPDSRYVASGSSSSVWPLCVWDSETGGLRLNYRNHSGCVRAVAWSPDGREVASGSEDTTVQIWDAAKGVLRFTYSRHPGSVNALAWSPDGKLLASGGSPVHVWNAQTGERLRLYDPRIGPISRLAWSPDGKRIASGSSVVQVWDAETGELISIYSEHSEGIFALSWSPDGTRIASAGGDGVRIWQAV